MFPRHGWGELRKTKRRNTPDGKRAGARTPKQRRPVFLCSLVAVIVIMVSMVALPLVHISAEEGKVITLGESLSPDQQTELLNYFGYKSGEDRDPITISTAETIEAMDGIFP